MKAYTYINKGEFALIDKPKPAIIEPTDSASARHVRQEPHVQDGRRRRMRLRGGAAAHKRRKDRHNTAHHPPLPAEQNSRSLQSVREQGGRRNKSGYIQRLTAWLKDWHLHANATCHKA